MKKLAVLLTVVFLLLTLSTTAMISVGAQTSSASVILFEDDFEGGKSAEWKWVGAENTAWGVEEKNSSDWLNMNSATNTVLKAGDEKLWSDYTVEYDFYPEHNPSYTGIFFRASENADHQMSGYLLQFMGGKATVYKFVNNNNGGMIASTNENVWETGVSQKVKVSAIGSEIKVYIESEEILSVTDETYTNGCIALRNSGTNIFIDNMMVTDNSMPLVEENVIVAESFDSNSSLDEWENIKGSSVWVCSNNWLKATGAESVKGVSISEDKKVNAVEFDVYIPSISNGYTGIYFNTEFKADGNHNNGYLLQFGPNTLTFLKAVNGSWASERGSASVSTNKALYHVEIEIGAGEITVKLNGETKITYADSIPYTVGKLAVRNASQDAYYDNFVVIGTDKYQKLEGQELFSDDFSSDLSQWETVVSVTNPLTVEDGWVKMQHATGDPTMLIKAGDVEWTDYSMEFDIKMSSTSGYTGVYLKAEYSTAANRVENGYLLQFTGGNANLYRVAGGANTQVSSATPGMSANTKYNVKIAAYGNSIIIKIDDQVIIDYTDNEAYLGGQIGFRNGSQNGFIDNVRVIVEDLNVTEANIENGDSDVAVDAAVTFTFNRILTASEKASIKVVSANDLKEQNIKADWNGTVLTITFPEELLYFTEYIISADFEANGALFEIGFTTCARPISIASVTVENADGTDIKSLNGEAEIDVVVNISNLGSATPSKIFLATYANQNLMRAVDVQTVSLVKGNTPVTFTDFATNFVSGDSNYQLKVFVWSDEGELIPLTQNAVFPTK